MYDFRALVAAVIIGAFGLFLIWQGLTGNVVKTLDHKPILPAWVYILCGVVTLILPAVYFAALLIAR